jgi:hypothetical protein
LQRSLGKQLGFRRLLPGGGTSGEWLSGKVAGVNTELPVWLRFGMAVLASWRITHLLAREDGPADVVLHLRLWLGNTFFGRLIDCFACLGVWVSAPLAVFVSPHPLDWIMSWLAGAGAAYLLELRTMEPLVIEPVASSNTAVHPSFPDEGTGSFKGDSK